MTETQMEDGIAALFSSFENDDFAREIHRELNYDFAREIHSRLNADDDDSLFGPVLIETAEPPNEVPDLASTPLEETTFQFVDDVFGLA